jgi:hypothetical protein
LEESRATAVAHLTAAEPPPLPGPRLHLFETVIVLLLIGAALAGAHAMDPEG